MKRGFTLGVSALLGLSMLTFAQPASAAVQQTTITMTVSGCEGCTIRPGTLQSDTATPYNGPVTKVKNGVATFTVPTAMTVGMTFALDASWNPAINAEPLIAFQYKGLKPGSVPTKAAAKASKFASPCWSGTSQSTITLDVVVKKVWMKAFPPKPGKRTQAPVAWVTPTQDAPKPFLNTFKGVLAVQDAIVCAP